MCSLSSTERKRTRRWLPRTEKICSDLKNTGAPLKKSLFGRVQNRHLVREVRVLAFGNRRTVLSRTISLHPSARMHGRAPDRFKLGAAGAPD